MSLVQPIRNKNDLERMKAYLRRQSYRDYVLFLLGCNTALRIGDLLRLTVADVRGKQYITGVTEKRDKPYRHLLSEPVRKEIAAYIDGMDDAAPLFPSRKGDKAITATQAWRIIKSAAEAVGIKDNIGTHTMRKSFGYHAYKQTGNKAALQKKFTHSSEAMTTRYLGIDDDEVDAALKDVVL